MRVCLRFDLSENFLRSHLIETGGSYTRDQIAVDLIHLTPEQRAIIVACYSTNCTSSVTKLDRVRIPALCQGVKKSWYGAPIFDLGAEAVFDRPPTVEEWLEKAAEHLATYDQWRPMLDAALAEYEAAKAAKTA